MAIPFLSRRQTPIDKSDLVTKALRVAVTPAALEELRPEERSRVDELAKALRVGANWAQPGVNSGTIAQLQRSRPVAANIVAQRAAANLNPAGGVTPLDIETAMRSQGMDYVNPFAPGQPLTPYYGYNRRPRDRNYQVSTNTTTQVRAGRIPFETLRQLVGAYDVAQICYRHAIQDLRSMRLRFEVMDGYEQNAVKEIAAAKAFMRRPDRKLDPDTGKAIPGTGNTTRNWLCKHATDVWRFDAGTMYRQRDRAGRLISLPIPDGTLFAPMLDYFGDNPHGEAPAFQQFIQGIPWDTLRWNDLIYEPMWPHTEDPYGIAPIETILVNADTDMRLQNYFLQFFTTGTVPEAFGIAPEDQSDPDSLADWQEQWNDWAYGDQSERWGLRWLPHGTELEFYKPQQFDPDVAEYVMRRTVAAFMMVPHDLGFTSDVNRSTADTQMDTQFRINSLPHVAYYEDIMDSIIQEDLDLPVQVRFDTGREKEDRLMEAQAHQIYVSMAAESADEVRDKVLGYAVNPEEKVPRFFDSQRLGPIPISYLLSVAGDIDPLTGAPRPGTVERRDIILPGTPGPDPVTPGGGDQYDQAAQHDASSASPVGGAGPKGQVLPSPPPPVVQPSAPQPAAKPAATNGPNPRLPAGVAGAHRSEQQTAARRALKEAGTDGDSDDDDDLAIADLKKWKAQSKSRLAKGKSPRPFLDSAIGPLTYEAVWKGLEGADSREAVDEAFAKAAEADGPVVAGVALVARDSDRVLMVQRGNKDDDGHGSSWETPAGKLEDGEIPEHAAIREWSEECATTFPKDAERVGTWLSEDGYFQGFVYRIESEDEVKLGTPDGDEIAAIAWWDIDDLDDDRIRDKVKESLDRAGPILDRAAKAATPPKVPRPGPGGAREQVIVQYHAPLVQQALTTQVNPTVVAGSFGAAVGATQAGAVASAVSTAVSTLGSIASSFAATLHIAMGAVEVAILALWADSWLAGAKDGRDSLDHIGVRVPGSDTLDQAVERVNWPSWQPGQHPEPSSLPGFNDVRSQLGKLITGISETTRNDIATLVETFVDGRVGPVPWGPDDVAQLAEQIDALLNDPNRAMLISLTEVNRSMSDAAIDLFKRSGITMFDLLTHVGACPICIGIREANPHPIGDIASTPPIHPRCRCSVAPVHIGRS